MADRQQHAARHAAGGKVARQARSRRGARAVLPVAATVLAAMLAGCGPSSGLSGSCTPASLSTGTVTLSLSIPDPSALKMRSNLVVVPQLAPPSRVLATRARAATANNTTGSVVSAPYWPGEIRTAYGMPALPSAWSGLSAAQAAAFGAGQTIYIIDAYDAPSMADELQTFNTYFGLPGCTTVSIDPASPLPLPPAQVADGCTFSKVYVTAAGAMTSVAPGFDPGGGYEHALDVEWSHAMAPLARIVLLEAPTSGGFAAAVSLVDTMGPGIVSMSYGLQEYSPGEDYSLYQVAYDSYVASTGDSGAIVQWPAVAPGVLAVGGTSLYYTGTLPAPESVWSGTGGGISMLTALPSYQQSIAGLTMRSVADVAMDADPNTGQFAVRYAAGSTTPSWFSAGGTSIAAPECAGILACANALRAAGGQSVIGAPHAMLYATLASPATYAAVFHDVTSGSNGSCSTCYAQVGYDQPTGLGTPNGSALLSYLATSAPTTAPVVSAVAVTGSTNHALSLTLAHTAPGPVQWALQGAPSGMAIDSGSGLVTWAQPAAGSYAVTVIAIDTSTGLSGSAVAALDIVQAVTPQVQAASVAAVAGQALAYTVSATTAAQDTLAYTLTGAPAGLTIDASGTIAWAQPVLGSYAVTVTATDTLTGLSGSAVLTLQVAAAASGASLTVLDVPGRAGTALSGVVASVAAGSAMLVSVSVQGAPVGMSFSVSGQSVILRWAQPVCGVYTLVVTLTDSSGLSTQRTASVSIA